MIQIGFLVLTFIYTCWSPFLSISYPIIMFQSYYCCFSVLKLALLILFFNWIVKYDLNSMWLSLMDCISCCLCLIGNREIEVNVVDGKIQLFHILENLEHPSLLKISFLGSSPVKGFEFMSTFISHSFKKLINQQNNLYQCLKCPTCNYTAFFSKIILHSIIQYISEFRVF